MFATGAPLVGPWCVADTDGPPGAEVGWPADALSEGVLPDGVLAGEVPPRLNELPASGFAALELDWATADPARLADGEVLDGVVGLDRVISWAQARQARMLAEFAARRGDTPEALGEAEPSTLSRYAPDEVGVALRLSRGEAMYRLNQATFLTAVVPTVLDAWESGALNVGKVRTITDALAFLPHELSAQVAGRVLAGAPEQSKAQLRAALARAVIAADPAGADQRHRRARRGRRVEVYPQPEGMASLAAYLSAPDARSAWEWLTRLARGLGAEDPRGMDARRADLLVALLTGRITLTDLADLTDEPDTGDLDDAGEPGVDRPDDLAGEPDDGSPVAGGGEPGLDEPGQAHTGGSDAAATGEAGAPATAEPLDPAPGPDPTGRAEHPPAPAPAPGPGPGSTPAPPPRRERLAPVTPGRPLITIVMPYTTLIGAADQPVELAGYGPIPPALAREIAADAVWRRLVTDPLSGTVLDYGRSTYHPPTPLADHVRARDLTCRGPRCRRPATTCELDHHHRYPDGPTAGPNLTSYCKHHHDLKHHGRWQVLGHPDATLEWITPSGYRYASRPHDYRPHPAELRSGLPDDQPPGRAEDRPPDPAAPGDDPPF